VRTSTARPVVDVVVLAAMIAIGGATGLACGHVPMASSSSSPAPAGAVEALCAYGGAATLVGFGLVNRMLRSTMFVVPIGAPIAWLVILVMSCAVGYVALPFVVGWRLCRVSPRPLLVRKNP